MSVVEVVGSQGSYRFVGVCSCHQGLYFASFQACCAGLLGNGGNPTLNPVVLAWCRSKKNDRYTLLGKDEIAKTLVVITSPVF